jgi:hypothetical protein
MRIRPCSQRNLPFASLPYNDPDHQPAPFTCGKEMRNRGHRLGASMSEPVRKAGLRGRNHVKPPGERFNIGWVHSYLPAPLPAPVYPVDVSGGITAWGMLGNGPDPTCTVDPNGVGDCSFAGRQHYRMAKAACEDETGIVWETSNQLVEEYLAYDHGQDAGANLADVLLFWYNAGRVLAFAPVDHTDKAAVDSAMQAFHGCYVGVNLTSNADQLFEQGQPWTLDGGPDPNDGHCIVKVKADTQTDTWVTWGAEQQSTLQWTAACLDEAWVIISQDDADATNLNLTQLRADIAALGGTGGS